MTRTRTLRFSIGSALVCAPLALAGCGDANEEAPEPHVNVPPDHESGGEAVPEEDVDWAVTNPAPPDEDEPPMPTSNPAPPEAP